MKNKIESLSRVLMPFGLSGNTYLIGAIGQGLGPLLLTPILTRRLAIQEFGEITFVTAISAILGILFSFGLPIVISRSYVLDENSRFSINLWFKKIIVIYILISIILLPIINFSIYVAVAGISLTFACMQLILPLARAQDRAKAFATISIVGTLLPSVIVIINTYVAKIFSSLTALQFGAILAALFSFILINYKLPIGQKIKKYSLTSSLKASYPILPHMFAMVALLNIDKVIFGQQLDKSFSGFLQVIMLIATAPIMILSALNHAWLNQILLQLKENSANAFKSLNQVVARLFVLTGLLFILIGILSEQLLTLLNPKISISAEIQKTIILTSLASFIYIIYLADTHLLTWLNKFWVLGLTTPLAVIVQSVVIYSTIGQFGYLSASLGFGAALTLQIFLLQIARSKTNTKSAIKPFFQLLPVITFWLVAYLFLA
jgi:O-antigen/teichoic acid export membrane protein